MVTHMVRPPEKSDIKSPSSPEEPLPSKPQRRMAIKRSNDQNEEMHFRSGRMLRINNEWFFLTREGETVGPFPDKGSALQELNSYIADAADDESNPT
jgi:Domain of unknown function (DUF6316)